MGIHLNPSDHLTEKDVQRGMSMLIHDGICSQIMGVLTSGAFLVAFAVLLGASNLVIGLLAAVGPFCQVLQIPAIFLVERTGRRKLLVVIHAFASRLFWIVVAVIPWFIPEALRIPVLLASLLLYFGLGTVAGCAWNSWVRDLVPESIMGSYFAKRMAISVALGAALTLGAGFALDYGKRLFSEPLTVYSIFFAVGAFFGVLGVLFLALTPEPRMARVRPRGIFTVLAEPFRHGNYRQLIFFLGSWNFAVNLAAPFFVVYMLKRLGLSMAWVLGLSVLSQAVNVAFLRIWGRISDRYTNKSVLAVSGPLFILSILIWPFTTMPERYVLTIPLLVAIHVIAGISTAGVSLCSGNIALKLAPRGQATAYLAASALVNGLAATAAPILAGIGADWFAGESLSLSLKWTAATEGVDRWVIPAVNLMGLDFIFLIAFVLGLYALHRLIAVREEGEVEETIVTSELFAEVRKAMRHVSNVAGLRTFTHFPYSRLRDLMFRNNRNGGPENRSPDDSSR